MRVLITGAGLVGCHTAKELTLKGHNVWLYDVSPNPRYVEAIAEKKGVRVVQGDLLDLPALLRALKAAKPDVVVHTGGFIGSQVANPPYRGIQTNILGSTHVFEACQLSGVRRVVHISTFGVYDWENIRRGPIKENFPRWGRSFYHTTKIANELLLGAYENHYGFEAVVIRPAHPPRSLPVEESPQLLSPISVGERLERLSRTQPAVWFLGLIREATLISGTAARARSGRPR